MAVSWNPPRETETQVLPAGVSFDPAIDKFRRDRNGDHMGQEFQKYWYVDRERFPKYKASGPIWYGGVPHPKAEKPTNQQMIDALTLLFDMAPKQANKKIQMGYIQVAAWLRDLSEDGGDF